MERKTPVASGGEQEGQILGGRYRLGQLLGTGSFGRVYEGHHTSLAQRVAIKVFRKDFVAHAGGPGRVLVDARAAARVHHRNVVDVHDLGPLDDTVYIATELVLGRTLHALLVQAGRLSWPRARGVALQIVAALKAAHKRNVLHRGLRAANCFVLEDPTRAGGELGLKVSDFGLAHPGVAGGGRGEEHTSPFVGDASYTAPELARGEAASVQSDVYAFGVILYRMLTGVLPFEGGTPYLVLAAHVSRPPRPPREVVGSIPAEVEAIVLRALAKDPGERFESARELELALEEVSAREEGSPEDAVPSAALDEAATGQHAQARPLVQPAAAQAPAPPARDEAMHAAFERREEPGEALATSMFARPAMVPYFGPADAPEAPPEPTIQLSAAMFLQLGGYARGEAPAYSQHVPTSPEPTVMLGAGAQSLQPSESTTLLPPPVPPTARLDDPRASGDAAIDGPTTHFPRASLAAMMRPAPSPGHGMGSLPHIAPAPAPMPAVVGHAPVIGASASAYAAAPMPTPAPVPAPARPVMPMPVAAPRMRAPARPSAFPATGIFIIGAAVAIAGIVIALALTCPAHGASRERSSSVLSPQPLFTSRLVDTHAD